MSGQIKKYEHVGGFEGVVGVSIVLTLPLT